MMIGRGTLAAVIATVTIGLAAPTAAADTADLGESGEVSMPDITATSGCVNVPIVYYFPTVPLGGTWTLTLSDGATISAYAYGDLSTSVGVDDALWCAFPDGIGRFTLTGELKVWDAEFNTIDQQAVEVSFTVSKQRTAAGIKVSDRTPKVRQSVRVSGCVSSGGRRDPYRKVTLQQRRPGKTWSSVESDYTGSTGCYAFRVKPASSRWLRVRVPATDVEYAAATSAVKVTTHG